MTTAAQIIDQHRVSYRHATGGGRFECGCGESFTTYGPSPAGIVGASLNRSAHAAHVANMLAAQEETDEEVEAAAKALFDVATGGLEWHGEHSDEAVRERFRNMARAALSAARRVRGGTA